MKKNSLLLIFFVVISVQITESQIVNKFGIKGGILLSKLTMSEFIPGITSHEPERKYKLLTGDIGIFAELFDSRFFCISTELHYNIKGEESFKDFKVIQPDETYSEFNYKSVNDRFHYLSLQILPRWKFAVNTEDRLYLFGGPKFDLRLSNSNSNNNEEITFSNGNVETGVILGIGNEIWELFYTEARYEYNFTNAYSIQYGSRSIGRKNNSFSFILGISIKKLFKINL